eukprot:1312214-Ditylum_brightwellii.AAC.1
MNLCSCCSRAAASRDGCCKKKYEGEIALARACAAVATKGAKEKISGDASSSSTGDILLEHSKLQEMMVEK